MTTTRPPSQTKVGQPQFRGRLVWNLLAVLLPLALIPTLVMGSTAYTRARSLLLEQLTSQLINLENKEGETVGNWIRTKEVRLENKVNSGQFKSEITDLYSSYGTNNFNESSTVLIDDLKSLNESITNRLFNQFMAYST